MIKKTFVEILKSQKKIRFLIIIKTKLIIDQNIEKTLFFFLRSILLLPRDKYTNSNKHSSYAKTKIFRKQKYYKLK